jgi:hypothetical protein
MRESEMLAHIRTSSVGVFIDEKGSSAGNLDQCTMKQETDSIRNRVCSNYSQLTCP